MTHYHVWIPGTERPAEPNVEADYPDVAAEKYVHGRWAYMDRPTTVTVRVEHVFDSQIVSQHFEVEAVFTDVRFVSVKIGECTRRPAQAAARSSRRASTGTMDR